jgi:hypothetical protein
MEPISRPGLVRHADHKSDDNADDSRAPNYAHNGPS